MEYRNDKIHRNVGYTSNLSCGETDSESALFSKANVSQMSKKITELLRGVDKYNRPIIVPDSTIISVMSSVYRDFRPETGDIYSRYVIPNDDEGYYSKIMNETINIIYLDVKGNLGMDDNNSKLSIWTTVLGDFNEHGLQSHPKIKLREKRPAPLQFNMNY